jgi:hypothetical protein
MAIKMASKRDMLYMKYVPESLGLKVKLTMVLEMDNQGAVCWTTAVGVLEVEQDTLMSNQCSYKN